MIGYHYTSLSNWKHIKKEGLIPYEIRHDELLDIFDDYPQGVWLWPKRLKGISHTGSVIYQLATKGECEVVLLSVNVDKKYLLKSPKGDPITLYHYGHVANFFYHVGEKGAIYRKRIKPKDIKLVDTFNVLERLK